jgi:hypothetical protein
VGATISASKYENEKDENDKTTQNSREGDISFTESTEAEVDSRDKR